MEYVYEKIHMDKDLPVKIYDLYFDQEVPVIEKHWHNSLEIIVPFSGNLQVWLNGEDLILTDQDILIVNSKEVHQFTWLKDNGVFKGYCLQIRYDYVQKHFLESDICFKQPIDRQMTAILRNCILAIVTASKRSTDYASMLVESELLKLLYDLSFLLVKTKFLIKSDKYKQKITDMVNYLEKHYNEDISMKQIASIFHMTERYFSKFFKENIGISPKQYLILFRLNHAVELLEKTDYPVTKIALICGFTSLSSFYSSFHKTYQKSPTAYRKKHESDVI